ncbi:MULTISPECIES: sigma factor-like helix-turn-helix DNA-binding protein [unclassified Paraburkholderia]|uniref:sigma factor-like helix-turn-helix DNA-binding protein n=1 Tax=unclassified Paraburkholderia TaxID=2615204 RepID=UPI002AB0B8FB|nr:MULTISPECIES: sigma factor-like helix-turn-helix DNA-binding protein [unclassified Paraburkholderia]
MAYPTLTMRKIREVLRLHFDCGFKQREIARAVGASPTTVGQYVRRMQRAGLSWPQAATLSDDELETQLYPPPQQVEGLRPEPDWPRGGAASSDRVPRFLSGTSGAIMLPI